MNTSLIVVGALLATWPASVDAAVGIIPGRALLPAAASPRPGSTTTPCRAERSTTGNFQVNCTRTDTPIRADFQLDQSETSVVAERNKVVAAFNDSYELFMSPSSQQGYSVSHDGGVTWTDFGGVPAAPTAQPFSDPSLAVDDQGNVWFTSIASGGAGLSHLELGLWEMPAGSDTFQLVSTPVVAPGPFPALTDKPLLAIGRDGQGRRHFYISYTLYDGTSPGGIQGPVELLDSTDGVIWRQTQLTESNLCEPATPGAAPVPDGNTVYVFFNDIDHAACANDPTVDPTVTSGREEVIALDVPTATILHRTTVAAIHGNGELVDQSCGGQQVIETAPGFEGRNASLPAPTLGPQGVLYDEWSDRPGGLGGGFDNATRIYLSYSRDGGVTWSSPRVISGPLSTGHMADRFQPALTSDAYGLHAIWYERIADRNGGPDLIQTDRADLTLAGARTGPALRDVGERPLSTVPWQFLPIAQTRCYAGDYNQVASNGVRAIATWTDLRNTAPTAESGIAHESDVFSDHWQVRTP